MNALKLISLSFALMIATLSMANVSPKNESLNSLKVHLEKIDFSKYVTEETKVMINFLVNEKNEVVVLSTNNPELDLLIKSAFNYKKINASDLEYNKPYTVPVVIR